MNKRRDLEQIKVILENSNSTDKTSWITTAALSGDFSPVSTVCPKIKKTFVTQKSDLTHFARPYNFCFFFLNESGATEQKFSLILK